MISPGNEILVTSSGTQRPIPARLKGNVISRRYIQTGQPAGVQRGKVQCIAGPPGPPGPPGSIVNLPQNSMAFQLPQRVAFSVARTRSLKGSFKYQKVLFDKMLVNIGGHFNLKSGIFTCAFPGVYHVSFSAGAVPGRQVNLDLMLSGKVVADVYNTGKNSYRDMVSRSLLLQLKPAETLWLRLAKGREYALYSDHELQTSFSVFLLYPDT
ncbi:hypothetical protein Bbelb_302010 [Branchiostoma belcheri]|nr:hypothetical protein Bbelb_302010 [Branchiostoma belcheri]